MAVKCSLDDNQGTKSYFASLIIIKATLFQYYIAKKSKNKTNNYINADPGSTGCPLVSSLPNV